MISKLLAHVFGSKNERMLSKLKPILNTVNSLETSMKAMSNEQLLNQTDLFKARFKKGMSLEELLPEAFALIREASFRVLGMRHYDVQILGGIILHMGKIAEMKTGEGKTLVATLPVYLNAITEQGVHVVTVNDYLTVRDVKWMGKLYNFLGMTVGTLRQGINDHERKEAYKADITYGTNNEFGFDYLRDNMKINAKSLVQRNLCFSIVDEVDSILIDEARTPLIISGSSEKSTNFYKKADRVFSSLKIDLDYNVDEKTRTVALTDLGASNIEKTLDVENIYDPVHMKLLHHVNQALKANVLFKLDVDYILENGQVIIVDEFTGRLMPGRRYSDGLHQALEAKEGVKIENENQTFASITFQNYFRMYDKLAGMTGTADTEAEEFKKIYNLDVVIIPTNKPMIRKDFPDLIYKTKKEKFKAITKSIKELNNKGQPVLAGTVSIENSEQLSKELKKYGIKHSVLNAKNHEREAEIIALAGQKKSVTISTNMAGRGTDIVLGNEVVKLGGLHVIGTERHESRRIDNQLRGRSGRQGDPGTSRFYLSLEDDLLRIFGGQRITSIMERIGMREGEAIEHSLINRSIENAQAKVEANNFDTRKHLLEYDDVLNQQREVIYKQRSNLLLGQDLKLTLEEIIDEQAQDIANKCFSKQTSPLNLDYQKIFTLVFQHFNFNLVKIKESDIELLTQENLLKIISEQALKHYSEKELIFGSNNMRQLERIVMLQIVDSLWKDHLLNMDHLKEGIGLHGYAQQNPLSVYKKEGFEMFEEMILRIRRETIRAVFRIEMNISEEIHDESSLIFSGISKKSNNSKIPQSNRTKIGRNSPCPCGSNKKYKKCCGQ